MPSADRSHNAVAQEWDTPSEAEIPAITAQHVEMMKQTDDDAVWLVAGMRHVMITLQGRKSGREQTVALPYWVDEAGSRVVVASFAGAVSHPAWFHNIADKTANPTVAVKDGSYEFTADAQILEGSERDTIWDALTADRAWYLDYQAKTNRTIPLVRLVDPT